MSDFSTMFWILRSSTIFPIFDNCLERWRIYGPYDPYGVRFLTPTEHLQSDSGSYFGSSPKFQDFPASRKRCGRPAEDLRKTRAEEIHHTIHLKIHLRENYASSGRWSLVLRWPDFRSWWIIRGSKCGRDSPPKSSLQTPTQAHNLFNGIFRRRWCTNHSWIDSWMSWICMLTEIPRIAEEARKTCAEDDSFEHTQCWE